MATNQWTKWRIRSGRDDGTGGFLCPPGHPAHTYSVIQGPVRNPRVVESVEAAINDPDVPGDIKSRVRSIMSRAVLIESEHWLRMVYGYFRSMYVPESGSRNASDLIVDTSGQLPAERSAAVAMIREFFPGHAPRVDLIRAALDKSMKLYGSYPCAHCGERVQYEPRTDSYSPFGKYGPCEKAPDTRHAWEQTDGDTYLYRGK